MEHFNFTWRSTGDGEGLACKMTRAYLDWLVQEHGAEFQMIPLATLPHEIQIIVQKALLARGLLNDIETSEPVQLKAGDWVRTPKGREVQILDIAGETIWLPVGDPQNGSMVAMKAGELTKIEPPVQPGDDQATDDELYIDEQLAAQAITDDLTRPIHLNDPDLQEVVERFNDRFLRGSIDDAEGILGDIQDVMGYLRVCQDTLNNEMAARAS